jgi:hypothetical protein
LRDALHRLALLLRRHRHDASAPRTSPARGLARRDPPACACRPVRVGR